MSDQNPPLAVTDALGRGRAALRNKNSFPGTGPYRRIRTNVDKSVTGVRAQILIPGWIDGLEDQAQPIAPLAILGVAKEVGSRPNIYLSARNRDLELVDIGIMVGTNDGGRTTALKPFATPPDGWTWTLGKAVPAPATVFIQLTTEVGPEPGGDLTVFRLWTEPGFEAGREVWRGVGHGGRFLPPWDHYAFVTSIAAPKDNLSIYGLPEGSGAQEAWCVGVEWRDRQVFDGGQWRRLVSEDILEFGAYPQKGDFLNSGKSNKWAFSPPVFVDELDGGPFDVAQEFVAIDMRRPKA